jgi:hypothetical protein
VDVLGFRASEEEEVKKVAPEAMRSLLYVSTPEWASQEYTSTNTMHPHHRRLGSMAAVLVASPLPAADALFEHMFTDNVDVGQRLLALECFAAAASELSGEPLLQPLLPPGMIYVPL